MSQQLTTQAPHSKNNYAIGGLRLLVRDKSENAGFLYLGNIYAPDFKSLVEYFQHYTASPGKTSKDANLAVQTGYQLGFTCDEMLRTNLRRFFLAAAPATVAANASATATAETFVAGEAGSHHGVKFGQQTSVQRAASAVYNVTDSALLVAGTDYDLVAINGWTFVRMKVGTHAGDTLRFGVGATAVTAYNYNQLAARSFAPLTKLLWDLEAILQFPAAQGVNMQWRIPAAQITPDGSLDWNSKEASSMKFILDILDDSANNPSAPFGTIEEYGYDDAGAALI